DKWNNPVPDFAGTAQWWCTDEAAELPKPLEFTKAGKGLTETSECVLNTPGRHFLRAILDTDLSAWNVRGFDVEVIEEAPELRLFWGELHNHGMLSYDARNWGGCTMRPHDAYWYAQHFTNLDFAAVTDHSMHNGRLRQQNMTEEQYQECQRAAADCYDAGKFVTFTAVEQRCARGDTNTYFLNDDETYYMRDDIMTVQQMWEYYRDVPIITIPHLHPMSKRKERFDEIDPEKERLIEIHSNHGRYEYFENEPLKPKKGMVDGNSVQQILARGHRLGIVAASDDHSGRPGVTDITGIYAPELTRPAIFEAMRARHTYGTTGPKMNVLLTMGEHMMGDDVRVSEGDALLTARTFGARVLATEPLTKIEIIRSGETIYSVDPDGEMAEFEYTDMDPLADGYLGTEINNPPTVYYYLRITQQPENAEGEKGLQMAWTSPIFISPEG
ncbi:MAG TPA: DUF3604 domain-containing protein, partial [Armatimonadota bacterium]|nr:DUF3604 domain-containing protein [Armatimonadota bacterium]